MPTGKSCTNVSRLFCASKYVQVQSTAKGTLPVSLTFSPRFHNIHDVFTAHEGGSEKTGSLVGFRGSTEMRGTVHPGM